MMITRQLRCGAERCEHRSIFGYCTLPALAECQNPHLIPTYKTSDRTEMYDKPVADNKTTDK